MDDKNKKSGYNKYLNSMFSIMRPLFDTTIENNKEDFGNALWNKLFNLDGPKQIRSTPSKREIFIGEIFSRFTEISNAYDQLQNIEIYLRRSPYNSLGVSKVQYLRYNIENYFHNIYVLKERLIAYLNFIIKSYKKSSIGNKIGAELNPICSQISSSLKNVTNTRSLHVHSERFSDEDLDRLATWELFTYGMKDDLVKSLFNNEYYKTRKKWKNTIELNNVKTKEIIDLYCDKLHSIIFINDNELIIPESKLK